MGKNGPYGNSAETHGYAHSDGVVRDYPETPLVVYTAGEKLPDGGYKAVPMHTTQEQYNRAFAEWVREFTAWKADMAAWREKRK